MGCQPLAISTKRKQPPHHSAASLEKGRNTRVLKLARVQGLEFIIHFVLALCQHRILFHKTLRLFSWPLPKRSIEQQWPKLARGRVHTLCNQVVEDLLVGESIGWLSPRGFFPSLLNVLGQNVAPQAAAILLKKRWKTKHLSLELPASSR